MTPRDVVIDACCMLNLLATRREVEIVIALGMQLIDTPQVSAEPRYLHTPPDNEGHRQKHPASTARLREATLLVTRALDDDALGDAFVEAAVRIEDTDASCIALAGVSKLPLLSDDGKARRVARELFPQIELVSTLDVLHDGSQRLGWSRRDLHVVATNMRWGGNFAPPKKDPRGEWYAKLLAAIE